MSSAPLVCLLILRREAEGELKVLDFELKKALLPPP